MGAMVLRGVSNRRVKLITHKGSSQNFALKYWANLSKLFKLSSPWMQKKPTVDFLMNSKGVD